MNKWGLLDLGFVGSRYTWCRNQTFERLDRALGNLDWQTRFPTARILHLPRIQSDHNPLLLELEVSNTREVDQKPFRFQALWLTHHDFKNFLSDVWKEETDLLSATTNFMIKVRRWSKTVFGDLMSKKKHLLARITGVQQALTRFHTSSLVDLEYQLRKELALLLEQEELLWYQRSRSKWLAHGDRNTKYFHSLTLSKKRRQRVEGLRDENGRFILDHDQLVKLAELYYTQLFTAEQVRDASTYASGLFPVLSESDMQLMDKECNLEEIKHALFSMGGLKAPGPDGIHALFYQSNWETVHDAVGSWVVKIFRGEKSISEVNETLLCLIPKVTAPIEMSQFRPIGLCNVTYKLITKILVHRLQCVLPKLIAPEQTSFVPERQMIDNIMVAQEVLHSCHAKKGKIGYMAIKIDLEKAYDRLNWSFILLTLQDIGLPCRMIELVMDCVRTARMRVLWNGVPSESFCPQRGVRQGDPLSPYLFVLCLERLAQRIRQLVDAKSWKPMKIGRVGPVISHLFFADDMLLFAEATLQQAELIQNVLQEFCEVSGQKVSAAKTRVLFSKNISLQQQGALSRRLGFVRTDDLGKYLGMPLIQGRVTRNTFAEILTKIDKRLAGWKRDKLSLAGRVLLANSVLSAIPAFAMQTIKLPVTLCDMIDKRIRSFIWGSMEGHRKMHLVAWEKVCRPKSEGGLGLKSMRQLNTAFLMKLAWRMMTKPEALWVQVLRSKYGQGPWDINNIKTRGSMSHQWRGILSVWDRTKNGLRWQVGSGEAIEFWHDAWLETGLVLSQLMDESIVADTTDSRLSQFVNASGCWNWEVMPELPLNIKSMIEKIQPPQPMGGDDKLIWGWSKNGKFSLQTAYEARLSHRNDDPTIWKDIWHWQGPPRIKSFLWLTAHEALLCNSKRMKFGLCESASCPRCGAFEETPIHVLRDCIFAKSIWSQLVSPTSWNLFCSLSTHQWLQKALVKNFSDAADSSWQLCFGVTVWFIWKWRNAHVFNADDAMFEPPMVTIHRFMEDVITANLFRDRLVSM